MKLTILFALIPLCSLAQDYDTLHVYFDTDGTEPKISGSQSTITYLKSIVAEKSIVKVHAFCDTNGSVTYNNRLSEKRLQVTQDYLIQAGCDLNSAKLESFGETAAAKSTRYTPAEFRRVDIIYKSKNTRSAANTVKEMPTMEDAITEFLEKEQMTLEWDLQILFYNSSDRFLPESISEVKRLLEIMQSHPELSAEFHGHVCCSDSYDISLSRAMAVSNYMINNQIDPERVSYFGHSNHQPKVYPELTPEDEKLNRRVAVIFKKN